MGGKKTNDLLNKINALQRLELGDLDRLVIIRNRILNNNIRQDDVNYVDSLFVQIRYMKKIEALPDNSSSRIWYMLPLLLSIVGGVVAYICLHRRDPTRARKTLLLGSATFAIFVAVMSASILSDHADVVDVNNLTGTADSAVSKNKIQKDVYPQDRILVDIKTSDGYVDESVKYDAMGNGKHSNNNNDGAIGISVPKHNIHTISYDDVPEYVDPNVVILALEQALHSWESSNAFLDFEITESDSNLHIEWRRWMPSGGLGLHTVYGPEYNGTESSIIAIRLGNDDCHSDYQPYSTTSLKHTIAHEIGHYLGLRHIDDEDHLMYSAELFDVDTTSTYDSHRYAVPDIVRPTIKTQHGQDILLQIESVNNDLQEIILERETLKNKMADHGQLIPNTKQYNEKTRMLDSLDDDLECVELVGSYLSRLK